MSEQVGGFLGNLVKSITGFLGVGDVDKAMEPDAENESYANGFRYENDQLFEAVSYATYKVAKNMAVIHFSWTRDLASLSTYFSRQIPPNTANSTWGVGKDGTVHRYLPDPSFPSWTNNGIFSGKPLAARFVTMGGDIVAGKYVNDHACAFEVVNINYEPYTEQQYLAVAKRVRWMLDRFPDFRIWRITGHEQLVPLAKDDPGQQWDWERFMRLCGVKPGFYREYLAYLAETSAMRTVGDTSRTGRKEAIITEALQKIGRDLSGADQTKGLT